MSFDPYSVFDVPRSADFETVRAVYRRLARENHPDIALDKLAATARMAQINRAWAILGDQTKRAAFDAEIRLQTREDQHQEELQRQAHQREQMRREALRREQLRRDAAQREIARAKARRNPTVTSQKMKPNAAHSTKNEANTRGGAAKTKLSARQRAREQKARETANKTTRAPRESRVSPDSASPRALRLMRKVTLAARIWHHDRNAIAAIEMCRAVLLADGRNVPARELLSEIFAAQNRIETALMMLDQAIQITPDDRLLRRKREHLQLAHSGTTAPRALPRLSFWQKLRVRLLKK